jgi:hypothetical protein
MFKACTRARQTHGSSRIFLEADDTNWGLACSACFGALGDARALEDWETIQAVVSTLEQCNTLNIV